MVLSLTDHKHVVNSTCCSNENNMDAQLLQKIGVYDKKVINFNWIKGRFNASIWVAGLIWVDQFVELKMPLASHISATEYNHSWDSIRIAFENRRMRAYLLSDPIEMIRFSKSWKIILARTSCWKLIKFISECSSLGKQRACFRREEKMNIHLKCQEKDFGSKIIGIISFITKVSTDAFSWESEELAAARWFRMKLRQNGDLVMKEETKRIEGEKKR